MQITAMIALLTLSGCEIGSTMFQMDSNSRSPFLGFDLLPARKTTAIPKKQDVPTVMVENEEPEPKKAVKLASTPPAPRKEPSLLESWRLKRPERIPLAVTPSEQAVDIGPAEEFR